MSKWMRYHLWRSWHQLSVLLIWIALALVVLTVFVLISAAAMFTATR